MSILFVSLVFGFTVREIVLLCCMKKAFFFCHDNFVMIYNMIYFLCVFLFSILKKTLLRYSIFKFSSFLLLKKSLLPPPADPPHLRWPLGHGCVEDLAPLPAGGPRSRRDGANMVVLGSNEPNNFSWSSTRT